MRHNDRQPNQLRPIEIIRGFTRNAPGAVLIRTGQTHVLCTASIDEKLPAWRAESGHGWVTAEYDMLPGATPQRRERNRLRVDGRTQEIQRLIGRSLRAVVDLPRLGPHTITLDCDVLQADGGTRTAAITGACVALGDALDVGRQRGLWADDVQLGGVAAVSVGICTGQALLDLDYSEDVAADVDCNLVMTTRGEWIEVQATAEGAPYSTAQLQEMMALGQHGLEQLFRIQQAAREQSLANGD